MRVCHSVLKDPLRGGQCLCATAAAQGALSQARVLGGSIGLSMATIVLNNKLSQQLRGVLDPAKLKALEQSLNTIGSLSPANQARVGQVYTDSFNEQMRICTYLSIFTLLAALATYERNPANVALMKKRQQAMADGSVEDASAKGMMMNSADAILPPPRPELPTPLHSEELGRRSLEGHMEKSR